MNAEADKIDIFKADLLSRLETQAEVNTAVLSQNFFFLGKPQGSFLRS